MFPSQSVEKRLKKGKRNLYLFEKKYSDEQRTSPKYIDSLTLPWFQYKALDRKGKEKKIALKEQLPLEL